MSATGERFALEPRLSLYEHATRLLRQTPDGPLPDGGRPCPDEASDGRSQREAGRTKQRSADLGTPDLTAVIERLVSAVDAEAGTSLDALQARLRELDTSDRMTAKVLESVPLHDPERARGIGLSLLRTATERRAVWLALGLLARSGRAADATAIRTVGLLSCCCSAAVKALAAIDGTTPDLIWLAERTARRYRPSVISALCQRVDDTSREWLLRSALDEHRTPASAALEIAIAADLPAVLEPASAEEHTTPDEHTIDQAMRLLIAITRPHDYRMQIANYPAATDVFTSLTRHAEQHLTPSLARHARVLSLLVELHSGHGHLLDWAQGTRELLLERLRTVLHRPEWTAPVAAARASPDDDERRLARWIDRIGDPVAVASKQTAPAAAARPRLAVEVIVPDPAYPSAVETRVLVDGRPVIARAFDRATAHDPAQLLERGQLRASDKPREVRLAEAWCTEGCCGALYVTIVREADTVLWHDWRRPPTPPSRPAPPPLPELRFDAGQYDAEIARAEADHSWEWPARTMARLLRRRLREEPDYLARWDCHPGWIGTNYAQPDQVDLSFTHPAVALQDPKARWSQFIWRIPDDGTPPERQTDAVLRRLAEADPTTYA